MAERHHGGLGAMLVIALVVIGGCERKPATDEPVEDAPDTAAAEPKFSWHDALSLLPGQARSRVQKLSGCDPEKRLPSLKPSILGFFDQEERRCQVRNSVELATSAYRVSEILYARKTPTAVLLKPTDETSLSLDVVETFGLPELPIVRRRLVDWEGQQRRAISLRLDAIYGSIDPGEPIAIDIVAHPDRPDRVDFVRVATISRWPYSLEHVQLQGAHPATKQVVAPRTRASGTVGESVSVEAGLDQVTVRARPVYPIRRNGDDPDFPPVRFDREARKTESDAEAERWDQEIDDFLRKWVRNQKDLGKDRVPVPFEIVATRTMPHGKLTNLMDRLEGPLGAEFHLTGRGGEPLDADFSPYVRRASTPVRLVTEGDIPVGVPDDEQVTALRIQVSTDGLTLVGAGGPESAVEGCPKEGPTLCARGDVDIPAEVEAAREHQRVGEFTSADTRIGRVLGAYDWGALQRRARRWKSKHPEVDRVIVSGDDEIPYAVVFRVLETVRWSLGSGPEGDCLAEPEKPVDIGSASRCTDESGEAVELFPDQALRASP